MRLPRGSAVLARGMAWPALRALAALCRQRGLLLLVGGDGRAALRLRAGLHVPERGAGGLLPFLLGGGFLSLAVHGRAGLARGRRLRADAALISPLFATASHPGARPLRAHGWAWLARHAGRPAVALGGVTWASRIPPNAAGRAGIGAFAGPTNPQPTRHHRA